MSGDCVVFVSYFLDLTKAFRSLVVAQLRVREGERGSERGLGWGDAAAKAGRGRQSGLTRALRPSPPEKPGTAMCVGCGSQIHDQFILRVSPDLEWHAACLKCAECSQYLDETCTCFVRDGKTYCKRDYVR